MQNGIENLLTILDGRHSSMPVHQRAEIEERIRYRLMRLQPKLKLALAGALVGHALLQPPAAKGSTCYPHPYCYIGCAGLPNGGIESVEFSCTVSGNYVGGWTEDWGCNCTCDIYTGRCVPID